MRIIKVTGGLTVLAALLTMAPALAATSPSLATASTYGILSSTYTNTVAGTTITGDLGYTTGPSVAPTVTGSTHAADGAYNQAGTDQGSALTALNSQSCTFSFASGAIDLATDTTHGTVGVYTPGVYCITGAASIGTGGIILNGNGVYIFRMTGALTTDANSPVTLTGGASSCDVWWTPSAATTLGANSTFVGNDIDASGITIGNLVTWAGNALAFGGTVSTSRDTITTSTCTATSGSGNSGSGGIGGTGSGSSNAGGTSSASNKTGAPDTGFGVLTSNPLHNSADYFLASLTLALLAVVARKTMRGHLK